MLTLVPDIDSVAFRTWRVLRDKTEIATITNPVFHVMQSGEKLYTLAYRVKLSGERYYTQAYHLDEAALIAIGHTARQALRTAQAFGFPMDHAAKADPRATIRFDETQPVPEMPAIPEPRPEPATRPPDQLAINEDHIRRLETQRDHPGTDPWQREHINHVLSNLRRNHAKARESAR